MRLWHQDLIPFLPRQQLLGQHRECAALRGLAWGKKHAIVDYVFAHPIEKLVAYHMLIIYEMQHRGYKVSEEWVDPRYRGKRVGIDDSIDTNGWQQYIDGEKIYQEHDIKYLQECLENLELKGIVI